MAKVTAVATVFPYTGLLRFLLSSTTQTMSYNKLYFPLKMPDCCLDLLSPPPPPRWWVVFKVVTGIHTVGRCAETPPPPPQGVGTVAVFIWCNAFTPNLPPAVLPESGWCSSLHVMRRQHFLPSFQGPCCC